MVHSLNTEHFAKNTNFVSVHRSNKKRRFNELDDCVMSSPKRDNFNNLPRPIISTTINNNYCFPASNNMIPVSTKKEINVSVEVDNIINMAKQSNSMTDLKSFIKAKILSYLSCNKDILL